MSPDTRFKKTKSLGPLLLLVAVLAAACFLSSCARNIGYGLVLWAGENSPDQTGQIYQSITSVTIAFLPFTK